MSFLSVFFFASFFFYYYLSIFLHLKKTIFRLKRLCFLVFLRIGEYISLELFYFIFVLFTAWNVSVFYFIFVKCNFTNIWVYSSLSMTFKL